MWLFTFSLACIDPPKSADQTAFETCDAREIELIAQKHGMQLVFNACGSNLFQDFSWSTDGHKLYFQLGLTHHVMDAASNNKATQVVPTPTPIGATTWLTATRLVLPVGPADGAEDPRLAVYDAESAAVFFVPLPGLTEPDHLHRTSSPGRVLFTAKREGVRKVFAIELQNGTVNEPFGWLDAVDTFTYTEAGNGVVAGVGNQVTLYNAETGAVRGVWAPATRGSLHPGGRWMVLEHVGAPVSVFQPVGIEELPVEERERQLRIAEGKAAKLDPQFPTTVRPPMFSFVDTHTDAKRYLVSFVQGTDFEWYETRDYYASFKSWGFEQKQFRRNVLLGDLATKLRAAEDGRHILGVGPFPGAPAAEPSPEPTP